MADHWSKSFTEPARANQMGPGTGMASSKGKPNISRVKYQNGVLYFCGAWEADLNTYWYLWCYSPERGWYPLSWLKSGSKDGVSPGCGPDGRICDFCWDNEGNMYVAGQFTRVRNCGGTEYTGVNALCKYHLVGPESQTIDPWRPVGNWHANGTVSHQGSIAVLCWDSVLQELYIGGNFSGIPGKMSFNLTKYASREKKYYALGHSTYSTPGSAHQIDDMLLDHSTSPPRLFATGIFKFAGGPKGYPDETHWSRMVSMYDPSIDDWSPVGSNPKLFDKIAKGFIQAGNPQGKCLLRDSQGNLWVGGGFASSANPSIAGIAMLDGTNEWKDPTGKGGFNRDIFCMAEMSGKIYVVGAFSAFADGTPASSVAVYDLASGQWASLDRGLAGVSMPGHFGVSKDESANSVYFAGDFRSAGDASNASFYVAQYSPTNTFVPPPLKIGITLKYPTSLIKKDGSIDIKVAPPARATVAFQGGKPGPKANFSMLAGGVYDFVISSTSSNATHSLKIPLFVQGGVGVEPRPGYQNWRPKFPKPANSNSMKANTGMSDGTGMPDIRDTLYVKASKTVYLCGDWQAKMGAGHWNIWSWNKKVGWTPVAYRKSQKAEQGPNGIVERMRLHEGRIYCCGALKEVGNILTKGASMPCNGVAVLDLNTNTWSNLAGTFAGQQVCGYVSKGGVVHDVAFDFPQQGDVMIGGSFAGLTELDKSVQSWGIHVRHANGEYGPMGKGIYTDPDKPNEVRCIAVDRGRNECYIGGGFVYAGGDGQSHVRNRCQSIARWDANSANWVRMGEPGTTGQMLEKMNTVGMGHWVQEKVVFGAFPLIRDIAIDDSGRVYVGGSVGNPFFHAYCLMRWNESNWEDPTGGRQGLSRDVYRMCWNESRTKLYLAGGFQCDGTFEPVGCAAVLDIASSTLSGLGGSGLTGKGFPVVVCCSKESKESVYFGGMFTHAGRAANLLIEKPQQSYYFAKYKPQ